MNLLELDKSKLYDVLIALPEQIKEACRIGEGLGGKIKIVPNKVLILGMGGSAIAGDLLRNYLSNLEGGKHIQIVVNRDYDIPHYIDKDWLVIASSYSGNTEETITAMKSAENKTKNIIGICTGGKLENYLKINEYPVIKIPGGLQPRAAIAYSFFPLLYLMMLNGAIKEVGINEIAISINKILELTKEQVKIFKEESEENQAYIIARNVFEYMPIIYTSSKYEVVNLRWRGQFQENSNIPSFGSILPEMNHNEINALDYSKLKEFYFFILKDKYENERVEKRFNFLIDLFKKNKLKFATIELNDKNILVNYFEFIQLADWISFWMGLMRGEDPTEIKNIMALKEYMS
jgi:glucose/mannose-6-phosphate isomerase